MGSVESTHDVAREPPPSALWQRRLVLLLALLSPIGLVILYAVPPTTASWYPRCLSYSMAGVHCPGCGTARGLHSLLNGEVLLALRCNVMLVLFLPYLLWGAYNTLRWAWTGEVVQRRKSAAWVIWAIGAVMITFAIARNIPHYPFTLLAPPLFHAESRDASEVPAPDR